MRAHARMEPDTPPGERGKTSTNTPAPPLPRSPGKSTGETTADAPSSMLRFYCRREEEGEQMGRPHFVGRPCTAEGGPLAGGARTEHHTEG